MKNFNFSNITNSNDILSIANLDFTVNKYPVISNNIQSNEYFGLISSNNNFFGIAKKNYTVIQNSEFFSFVDMLLNNNFKVESAYQFKSKSILKVTQIEKFKVETIGDLFETSLFIQNDFSGKNAGSYQIYNVRLACTNGMKRKEKESEFSIKHFANYADKLKLVENIIFNTAAYHLELNKTLNIMNEAKISDNQFNEYINNILKIDEKKEISTRAQNIKNDILALYNNKPDLKTLDHSYYRAYNAVSDYFSNHVNYKNSKDNELVKETSLVFGNNLSNAFELALELSQN